MRVLHLLAVGASFNEALAFTSLAGAGVISPGHQGLFALDSQSGHDQSPVPQTKPAVATRKSFIDFVGVAIASPLVVNPLPVSASGGATAGGAYLLSGIV
jgi:hypothetical protein